MKWLLKLWNSVRAIFRPLQRHFLKFEKLEEEMQEIKYTRHSSLKSDEFDFKLDFNLDDMPANNTPTNSEAEPEAKQELELDPEANQELEPEPEAEPESEEEQKQLTNPVKDFFDKQIQIVEKHIQIITALNTTPEVKNVLIKHEEAALKKYDHYMELIKGEKNAEELRKIFGNHFGSLHGELCGEVYDENFRSNMASLADLYKQNGNDRRIVDLFNEMEDFIDAKNTKLLLEESPRFARGSGGFSTYKMIPYLDRVGGFSKDLEILQDDPKKFHHLYGVDCDINNLVLHHMPAPNEDFTTYRDVVNNMEYVKLYNGNWQVSEYDPRTD